MNSIVTNHHMVSKQSKKKCADLVPLTLQFTPSHPSKSHIRSWFSAHKIKLGLLG